jgi:hypothetical protein
MSLLPPKETKELQAQDRRLLAELDARYPHLKRCLRWRNGEVRRHATSVLNGAGGLSQFKKLAERKGLFDIRFERQSWVDSDGERRVFTLARAAVTEMFPMGTHFWLRDNSIIGARFLKVGDARQQHRGKEVLLSCLSFISSVAQLERFEDLVRTRSRSFLQDVRNWPGIFAAIKDNLIVERNEGWAHKQDAWQMLAWYVLEALEDGRLSLSDLTKKHKKFLGLIVPFLAKVSFWRCANSGSWEEIEAVRTSVRAWEHRLVVLIGELARKPRYRFLVEGYVRSRRHLAARFKRVDITGAVSILDKEASRVLLVDLPFESPGYSRRDPRFRKGDAALIYLLEIDYIDFLAGRTGRDEKWARAMEDRILSEVLALRDDRSGAIYRYRGDSYQRSGFFRFLTTTRLRLMYGAPSGDASAQFAERSKLVPRGRQAAWTHFVWQLSAWAGKRLLETGEQRFGVLHDTFFIQGLALITGNEGSLDLNSRGAPRTVRIPAWRMPECYIADITSGGKELLFPSPHTPLNWAVIEMVHAFKVRKKVLEATAGSKN